MKQFKKICRKRFTAAVLAAAAVCSAAACGNGRELEDNLIVNDKSETRPVNMFSPMGKTDPNAENIGRTAQELTLEFAEEKLGVAVEYNTYTANDYKEKTYDDVCIERIRSNMDDFYLLNPDVFQLLGKEGLLADLSVLDSAKNLREVVKTANTVDGRLVAIPQEIVAYGLFINKDLFDKYSLNLPETPEDLLACCEVLKENGYETPIGANRWWLETFVFAQAYADLYNGDTTAEEIEALNSGRKKYSDYMRPGFEFLQTLIDKGYIDAGKAITYEAIDGEGPDFKAQKTPIVMAFWGAANTDTQYGKVDFDMQVIGFPSSRGQMPVVSMTGYSVCAQAEHYEDAMDVLDTMLSDEALTIFAETKQVISSSKNVEAECVDALKPLNEKINEGVYVLASNAGMQVEQWGNTCLIVRDLLNGASVDECMEAFDRLQEESLK